MPHRGISQSGYGLREQSLSPLESFAQSLGSVAPTATPTFVIPLVFALGGNATWLIYLIATIGIIMFARIINQFSRHTASPGSLYAYTTTGLGPWVGRVSAWALLAAYAGTGAAVTGGFANYVKVLIFGWIELVRFLRVHPVLHPRVACRVHLSLHASQPEHRDGTLGGAAIVLLLIALIGNLYPVPAAPYS